MEIVGSAREAGEITTAQQMLTRVLSERMTPEQRQVASGNVWELSKIKWQFDFELNPKPVNYPENFIQQRGYYEFFSRPSTPYQTTEVTVLGNMSRKEEVTDSANNRIVRIYPQYWSIPVKVRMVVTKTPVALKLATEDVPADKLPADIRPYLGKSNQIDPTGPIAQSIAQKLRGKNRAETIENIREWVMREVKYQNPVLPGEANKRDSETVLSRKRGYCWEIGRAMTAVLRAAGIPARRMFMINVYPERGDDIDFSSALPAWCHVMAEFWDPKAGWSPCQNRPSSVVAMRYIPLASEMMVEQNPDGTVERVANETFYGNHESPTKKAVCNSVSLKVLSAFLR
ncbi:MAG: transglutaminase domain-containing protein [Armatimonadetes bacterium]|nr:transglutaminase domain-containing protein [Armatimonadota bacterium]